MTHRETTKQMVERVRRAFIEKGEYYMLYRDNKGELQILLKKLVDRKEINNANK